MMMPPRSTDDAALAQEIRVLEDCGMQGPRLVQGLAWLRELQQLRARVMEMGTLHARIAELKTAATEALDAWADEIGLVANQDDNYDRLRAVIAKEP